MVVNGLRGGSGRCAGRPGRLRSSGPGTCAAELQGRRGTAWRPASCRLSSSQSGHPKTRRHPAGFTRDGPNVGWVIHNGPFGALVAHRRPRRAACATASSTNAPPASVPAALVSGRPSCARGRMTHNSALRAGTLRGTRENADERGRARQRDVVRTSCGGSHCEGGGKDAADRVVDDSEREAARCRRVCAVLRAGGPHMNSKGPPNGVRGAGRMPAALWGARPTGV